MKIDLLDLSKLSLEDIEKGIPLLEFFLKMLKKAVNEEHKRQDFEKNYRDMRVFANPKAININEQINKKDTQFKVSDFFPKTKTEKPELKPEEAILNDPIFNQTLMQLESIQNPSLTDNNSSNPILQPTENDPKPKKISKRSKQSKKSDIQNETPILGE